MNEDGVHRDRDGNDDDDDDDGGGGGGDVDQYGGG